jgi:phosphate acyltransferase
LVHRHDYSAYGGAPLLGIDGICIICHGSSGERAIKNALKIAGQYATAGLNEKIVQELATAPAAVNGDE